MQVFGPNELCRDVLEPGLCTGCGACVDLCPYLGTHRGKTAMLFACDRSRGRCHAFCPKTEVDLDSLSMARYGTFYTGSPAGESRQILMGRAGKAVSHGEFQDGGSVSALMMYALESRIVDAAVLTGRKGLVPVPGLAVKPQEVRGFSYSKYTAAPTISALNKGYNDGFTRMGVVGTPCQLTAVAKMSANPMEAPDFADPAALTIGLFCTWALDTRKFISFIEKRVPGARIKKMRVLPPPAGVMEVDTDEGVLEIPIEELRHCVPEGCSLCPDMTAEWADISVGAMEGSENWNTLIVRTEKGERLVRHACTAGYLDLDEFPEQNRSHLLAAAGEKKRRAFEKACSLGLVNTEKEGVRAVLRVNRQTLEKIISDRGEGAQ
ncbi:MAG: Coenzyme F420 hydrogenase/dehydrogenase, beta subunit C-terminal domain [bacterium]